MAIRLFVFTAVVVGVVVAMSADAGDDKTGEYRIATKRPNDSVRVERKDDAVAFAIASPFGISHATIERLHDNWPAKVKIQLALRGLEHFAISNGEVKLEAAVNADGQRLWKDGDEKNPLDAKSPFWMSIRAPKDGSPFEMTLPSEFFKMNPKSIELRWIDFYRN